MSVILKILSNLFGFVGQGQTRAAGIGSGIVLLSSIGGALLWLFGPGREWSITLNALELAAVGLGSYIALSWFLRVPSPTASSFDRGIGPG